MSLLIEQKNIKSVLLRFSNSAEKKGIGPTAEAKRKKILKPPPSFPHSNSNGGKPHCSSTFPFSSSGERLQRFSQ